MRNWTSLWAAWAMAALFVGAACDSKARVRSDTADSCAALADVVYGEIFVSVLLGGHRLPPEPVPGDLLSCEHAAASVSAGFTRALSVLDVHVTWPGPGGGGFGVCAAGDLAMCVPQSKPSMPGGALDSASVADMWQIVSSVVARRMPLGTANDRASFHEYELRLRLSDALIHRFWNIQDWARPRSNR